MQLISFIASVMTLFVYQKILCVYVLEKMKTILHFFSHSPKIVDEKYFRWKWTHFRKIYQGRLSFFWSWRHFLDTSRLTKILEGTLARSIEKGIYWVNHCMRVHPRLDCVYFCLVMNHDFLTKRQLRCFLPHEVVQEKEADCWRVLTVTRWQWQETTW